MKTGYKILIGVGVVLLVCLGIFLFIRIFYFEEERLDKPSIINDDLVTTIYSYNLKEEDITRRTFYNNYTSNYNNLDDDYVKSSIYNYLAKNNLLTTSLTTEELKTALNKEYQENYIPKYKIPMTTFNDTLNYLYGEQDNLTKADFNINKKEVGHYSAEDDSFYIYEIDDNFDSLYYVYQEKDSYAIKDNKETLIIYVYFVKCDIETGKCYNDDKMTSLNNNLTYSEGILNGPREKYAKYKHTYKLASDHFYWYSSEIINK